MVNHPRAAAFFSAKPERSAVRTQPGAAGHRTVLYLCLLLFLNLQGDGFRLAADPTRDQILLLPLTLLFCALVAAVLWLPKTWADRGGRRDISGRTLVVIAAATLVLTFGLLVASAHHYAAFQYRLALWPTVLVFALAELMLLSNLHSQQPMQTMGRLLPSVLLASLAVQLLCLRSFPLDIRRSDMLPLLAAANRALHLGIDPYRLYTFPTETVLLSYLPGTLLAYWPTTLLHLDLRLTNLICLTLLALIVSRAAAVEYRSQLTALLAVWLLAPYLVYRHEIYTPPHWLALVAALLLLLRERLVSSAILFGVSVALSQFSWILLPFVLLYLFERRGIRPTLTYAALALGTAGLIVLPFVLWSPHVFLFGVLSHWQYQTVSARPVNLSFWLATLLSPRALQPVQFAFLGTLFFVSVARHTCSSFTGLLRTLSFGLAGFILLNILVWGYFFLLLELLLLLFVASANGWLEMAEAT